LRVGLPVTALAKYKTVIQMVAMGFLLSVPSGTAVLAKAWEIGLVLFWVSALLTLWTGLGYLRTSLAHINSNDG
jgi:cardiolipin synthase